MHCKTWWTFRIVFIFYLVGEGEGRVQDGGGGDRFFIENARSGRGDRLFIENPSSGGGFLWEGEGSRGSEGVCGELENFFGGGGLNIFFWARNVHQEKGGSEKSTFLAIFWGFLIFSGAAVL